MQVYYFSYNAFPLLINSINAAILGLVILFLVAVYYIRQTKNPTKLWVEDVLVSSVLLIVFYWFHTSLWASPYHILASIVYAAILFLLGTVYNYKFLRIWAYIFGACATLYFAIHYTFINLLHPYYWIRLNTLFVVFIIAFALVSLACYNYKYFLNRYEQVLLPSILRLGLTFLIYAWIRANIIIWFDPVQQPGLILARIWGDYDMTTSLTRTHFTNVILTIYYAVYALITIGISVVLSDKWLRYFGIVLVLTVLAKLCSMLLPTITSYIGI